jgi:PPOX class probable F420-dependent enzyme
MAESNKTTVTSANSMSAEQIDAFLSQPHVARLGTIGRDGQPHVTPVWYVWEDGQALVILGERRQHLRNLRRDARATLCIDEDYRLAGGFAAGAQAVVLYARASIDDDEAHLQATYAKEAQCYLGPAGSRDPAYRAAVAAERRRLVVLRPERIVSWDFR